MCNLCLLDVSTNHLFNTVIVPLVFLTKRRKNLRNKPHGNQRKLSAMSLVKQDVEMSVVRFFGTKGLINQERVRLI
jgi:hypothetical protein